MAYNTQASTTPAVSGPVAMATVAGPRAHLEGSSRGGGRQHGIRPQGALDGSGENRSRTRSAVVPMDSVAARPRPARGRVDDATEDDALAGMVSLFCGVQLAAPSTAKLYSMCATLTPFTWPLKRARRTGAPDGGIAVSAASSAAPMSRLRRPCWWRPCHSSQ